MQLTITLRRVDSGRLVVDTEGNPNGDWLGRDVRYIGALVDALHGLTCATASTDDAPLVVPSQREAT